MYLGADASVNGLFILELAPLQVEHCYCCFHRGSSFIAKIISRSWKTSFCVGPEITTAVHVANLYQKDILLFTFVACLIFIC